MSTEAAPKLSVIVVNWNVRELLSGCLRSLEEQMLLPLDAWELFVVDNASSDGSVEMIRERFPKACVIANRDNRGFGKANNQAYRLCRGEYVLLLNPDTVILDHAVDRMIADLEDHPDVAALGCRLLNADGSFQRWTGGDVPNLWNVTCHFLLLYRLLPVRFLPPPLYLERDANTDLVVGWVSGACMLLRASALGEQIFNESYFLYGEDLELCDRLRHAGWKIVYSPRSQVVHYDGRSLAQQSPEVRDNKLKSLREFFISHNGRRYLLVYDIVLVAGFLLRTSIFEIAAWLRPQADVRARRSQSRRFLVVSWRNLVGRG